MTIQAEGQSNPLAGSTLPQGSHVRVGLIAPPWLPVPPTAYGGTELVIDLLARGLVREGHDVRLFTVGESTCPVPSAWRNARSTPTERSAVEAAHTLAAYDALTDVDIVHDHTVLGPLVAGFARRHAPVVTTLHSPFTADVRRVLGATARDVPVICISQDQRRAAPEIPVAAVIHHGIDLEEFPASPGTGGYLLFLGRMSPDKGVDRAITIARTAGLPLRIAAKMQEPAERAYYRERIEPMLGGDVEYVGEVGASERLTLLQGAVALLNPIRWPEPFGLVMIEALASGTPVIATAQGSAPEIVEHGRTGYLCLDEPTFVRAVMSVQDLDRRDCREAAVRRFSAARMVSEHVGIYGAALAQSAAAPDVLPRRPGRLRIAS